MWLVVLSYTEITFINSRFLYSSFKLIVPFVNKKRLNTEVYTLEDKCLKVKMYVKLKFSLLQNSFLYTFNRLKINTVFQFLLFHLSF